VIKEEYYPVTDYTVTGCEALSASSGWYIMQPRSRENKIGKKEALLCYRCC